jgi:hypothetical protein
VAPVDSPKEEINEDEFLAAKKSIATAVVAGALSKPVDDEDSAFVNYSSKPEA